MVPTGNYKLTWIVGSPISKRSFTLYYTAEKLDIYTCICVTYRWASMVTRSRAVT